MASTLGVRKIIAFNWPWYALALTGDLCALLLWVETQASSMLAVFTLAGLLLGNSWLFGSLLVSHWVYDRSALARGAWLDSLDPNAKDIAVLHAGQDEASHWTRMRFPNARTTVYDFFDPDENTEASLRRARAAAAPQSTVPVHLERLPMGASTLDLALVVFAAHEIRSAERLAAFFAELLRGLRPGGTLIVVEHLRDCWNALAYGPGAWHFLPRRAWLDAFDTAGLHLAEEARYTPFVTRFRLTRKE